MEKDVEEFKAEADVPLVAVTAEKFGELEIKPREFLLNPCITAQSLGMIHAPRGCGKTSVTLGLVVAMASGTEWLKWDAPKPVGVLYVDGELPAIVLRDKLKMMVRGMNGQLLSGALKIITPDLQNRPMPDLSLPSGQALIEQHLDGVSVLILDNLSCLVQAAENEDQDWAPVQQWLLALRRRGIAVLFIHHSGKSGKQRGIS
jgi:putative DNA primase/helicase